MLVLCVFRNNGRPITHKEQQRSVAADTNRNAVPWVVLPYQIKHGM